MAENLYFWDLALFTSYFILSLVSISCFFFKIGNNNFILFNLMHFLAKLRHNFSLLWSKVSMWRYFNACSKKKKYLQYLQYWNQQPANVAHIHIQASRGSAWRQALVYINLLANKLKTSQISLFKVSIISNEWNRNGESLWVWLDTGHRPHTLEVCLICIKFRIYISIYISLSIYPSVYLSFCLSISSLSRIYNIEMLKYSLETEI